MYMKKIFIIIAFVFAWTICAFAQMDSTLEYSNAN